MDTDPPVNRLQCKGNSHQLPVSATTGPAYQDGVGSDRARTAQTAAGNQVESARVDACAEESSADASVAASFSDGTSNQPTPPGFDRQIHVFTREAVAAAEASNRYSLFAMFTAFLIWIAACYSRTPD